MFGTSYELNEAPTDEDFDYYLRPHKIDMEEVGGDIDEARYRCWEITDEKFHLAVEDGAPDEAVKTVESEGWTVVDASDAEKEYVKDVDIEIHERPAYYLEEPPENRYQAIGRNASLELLEHRGVDYSAHQDSWWYPEKRKVVVVVDRVDDHGNLNTMVWQSSKLSQEERDLILEEEPLENEDELIGRQEIKEIIYEHSALYDREADIAACWWDDTHDIKEILRWIDEDITYQAVNESKLNYLDKAQKVAWEVQHVWHLIPDEDLPEECKEILEAVESVDPQDPEYYTE